MSVSRDNNNTCEDIICKGGKDNTYVGNLECEVPKNEKCPGKMGDGTYIDKYPESIKGDKRICQPV